MSDNFDRIAAKLQLRLDSALATVPAGDLVAGKVRVDQVLNELAQRCNVAFTKPKLAVQTDAKTQQSQVVYLDAQDRAVNKGTELASLLRGG